MSSVTFGKSLKPLRLSFKRVFWQLMSKYFVHENTLDRCVSLLNIQGREYHFRVIARRERGAAATVLSHGEDI